jgi:hypothetical protein
MLAIMMMMIMINLAVVVVAALDACEWSVLWLWFQ